ncbi:hypothetical protein L3X38_037152 [Prunus dulcis]|uniref:Uncharacterized protein n=1 Tax=Prunus dulcis TaxID=3755 RepID=A0AAD4V2K0_PRUDU|nr:hypothetical protein L3X38_037152 [Prunus dulcis]
MPPRARRSLELIPNEIARKKTFQKRKKIKKEDVDRKFEKLYPTWDDRIDEFSQVELIKLIGSLEAKIQASSKKIDFVEQNRNVSKAEEHHTNMCWKPTNQVPDQQTCPQFGAFNMISINTTILAL